MALLDAAHDLRNLLTVITGNCDLASSGKKSPFDAIAQIRQTVEQCTALLDAWLAKARAAGLNINMAATHATASLLGLAGLGITLVLDLDPNLASPGPGDSADFFRALFNLCLNAKRAIEYECPTGRGKLRVTSWQDAEHIYLDVEDNGCGMSLEVLERVMRHDPANADEHGRGLSIVRRTVAACKGELLCKSVPGQGTIFTIRFPRGLPSPLAR